MSACFLFRKFILCVPTFYSGLVFLAMLSASPCLAQQHAYYTVTDLSTHHPIPFATVKFGDTNQGIIADLDGRFVLPADVKPPLCTFLSISSLGYQTLRTNLPLARRLVALAPDSNSLGEVTIKPPYDKIRRILREAIAHKDFNNPDKIDWYRCQVYYKMFVDIAIPDSLWKDTTRDGRDFKNYMDNQHLLLSETRSIRTWKKPQTLQEDVLASRFSGLKKSVFTSLVTDVVPFHAYYNYLVLNGKEYHNPVSAGYGKYYRFNLSDEIIQGADTTWVLSFRPRGHNANELSGKVFINSDNFAISHIVAKVYDTMLRLDVRIEQEYSRIKMAGSATRWFPRHLNYQVDYIQADKKSKQDLHFVMKGSSVIDSVNFSPDPGFRFDRAHTVKLLPGADIRNDSAWLATRPEPLDKKESRTYHILDSLGDKYHADRYVSVLNQIPVGRVPVGFLDIDLSRLLAFNYYENTRVGAGLQTNTRFIKWLSLGGWAGYGIGDKQWKYGLFTEAYADPYREFVIRAGYTDEINDPGRIHISRDLDKNYLDVNLLRRVDETRTWYASVRKKMGYLGSELSLKSQQILPRYAYALESGNSLYSRFFASEASLSLRYAFAERTAPVFGYYYSLGSRYPIIYGKITGGVVTADGGLNTPYEQLLFATTWQKHINRLGKENFLVEAGKSWSDNPLPLGKLFAGNGYKYDVSGNIQESVYTFGGIMTIYPYQFYTDQFVSLIFRHDFDWRLYKLQARRFSLSSAPYFSLQYDVLYGTLQNPLAQRVAGLQVPDNACNEAGLLLNSLVRWRYFNVFYFTLNTGYFYHIIPYPIFDGKVNGRFALGAGVEF